MLDCGLMPLFQLNENVGISTRDIVRWNQGKVGCKWHTHHIIDRLDFALANNVTNFLLNLENIAFRHFKFLPCRAAIMQLDNADIGCRKEIAP